MHEQDWRQAGLPKQEEDAFVPSGYCRAVSIGTSSTVAGRVSWTRRTSLAASWSETGLSEEEKELVVVAFKCGAVSVLTATSGLAAGVNLPARRVIFRWGLGFRGPKQKIVSPPDYPAARTGHLETSSAPAQLPDSDGSASSAILIVKPLNPKPTKNNAQAAGAHGVML